MAEDKFDPRDLISPPWRSCPACGKDQFGIAYIGGSRILRRCRACWHKLEFALPKLRKKIIYLDQFIVSNLLKLKDPDLRGHNVVQADPFWQELHDLLSLLRNLQLICCPDSGSHVEESLISPNPPPQKLKRTYENLSSGITFKNFNSIRDDQIGELAYAWADAREPVFDFNQLNVLSRDPNGWSERFYMTTQFNPFISLAQLKLARAELQAEISRLFTAVWSKETHDFEYWYQLERTEYQNHLVTAVLKDRYERQKAALNPGGDPLEMLNKILPSPAELLITGIQEIFKFTKDWQLRSPEERNKLGNSFFEKNRIADAPCVKFQALLYAAIAMQAAHGQKEPPNEGMATDVKTVAHLLPYCDAMFMDNPFRALLLHIPKKFRPPETEKVFSLNTKTEFLAYLRSIRDGATPGHLAAVRDVYGDKYLEGLTPEQN
jgi:hypothetical protein